MPDAGFGMLLFGRETYRHLSADLHLKALKSSSEGSSDNCHKFFPYALPCKSWTQGGDDPTVTRFIAPALRRRKQTSRGKRGADLACRHARGSARHLALIE